MFSAGVVGGSGLLGRAVCRKLVERGQSVISLSRRGIPSISESWQAGVTWHRQALGSEESISLLREAQTIYHLASSTIPATSNAQILFDMESNIVATVRMLEALRSVRTRVIFVSSGGTVYGRPLVDTIPESHPTDPISAYGIHKLAIEKYLGMYREVYGLPSVILRPANIYGESQDMSKPLGALGHFARKAYEQTPIEIWGDGTAVRDYVHVEDVADAILLAAEYKGEEHVFNIGSGQGVSLLDIVQALNDMTNRINTVIFRDGRSFDVARNVLDSSRAKLELGWQAKINLYAGLGRMLESFR